MYPQKQDKNQKLRKVQGLYRKKKQKYKTKDNVNKYGRIVVSICVILFFFFLIIDVLFDIGVPLPEIFGR
ncbi:preprotein translocase subunit SecE [Bacillus ectoiniformans]|nr:preprotein translocase subunit SecE [Bacillus ectoiniformans]